MASPVRLRRRSIRNTPTGAVDSDRMRQPESARRMKAKKSGVILMTASTNGTEGHRWYTDYNASKAGVILLTKSMALELAPDVRVNCICPGYVLTPLVEKQIPATAKARGISEAEVKTDVMLKFQPTKEFVGTDEVAAIAMFLASDAAKSINGTHISVDGGWTAQ